MKPEEPRVVAAEAPEAAQPANTLEISEENIGANIIATLAAPTDESAGAAPDATTPAPGEPEAAPATEVEEKPPAEAEEAKMHRVSQHNSQMRAVLTKLGIDPDGDTMEAINSGLVTADEVLAARRPVAPAIAQPEASPPTAPEVSFEQKIDNLKSILDKPIGPDGIGAENIKEQQNAFLGVIASQAKEIENIKQSQEKKDSTEKANDMVAATGDVFNAQIVAELSAELPEDENIRKIGAEMFLGATDIENMSLVGTYGREKAVTPEGYRHSATQIAPKMKQFIQAIYKKGQDSMNPNPNPPNPPAGTPASSLNVLRPGVGGGSPPPPEDKNKFTIENMKPNTEKYFASLQPRV